MKRRETKGGRGDAGRRASAGRAAGTLTPDEDRLSGLMPDARRLSAVSGSALVRAGSRWLSFARTFWPGRAPLAGADTLAFVESLYGGKFKAVEGGAFSFDKVYRMAGGGRFVSVTRLSVGVHPRFDLRLLNVAGGRDGSQVFGGARTTTSFTLLSHPRAYEREQPRDARHGANVSVAAPSFTVQTWNVLPAGAGSLPPAFGYVSVRVQRAPQAQSLEPARPSGRGVRLVRAEVRTRPSAETSRPYAASAPASLRLTSLDVRRPFIHAPRQEFVSLLLKTYLHAFESREALGAKTGGDLSGASRWQAAGQSVTGSRFAPAPGGSERQPPARMYAEPAPRRAPGVAVEIRREFRSAETVREYATATNVTERGARHPMLQVLPPASLLLSLSESSLTLLAGGAGGGGRTTYRLSGRAPALTLQHLHAHAAPPRTREGATSVYAPRLVNQTTQHQPSAARELRPYLYAFVGRVHPTLAAPQTQAVVTRAGYPAPFTRPGLESALRRGFGRVSFRQRGAPGEATPGQAAAGGLFGPTVEFVRPAYAAESSREASTHDADTRIQAGRRPGVFSTQSAPGAGTFLFATGLPRRSAGATAAGALSPTAATALRLAAAAGSRREAREARAARPEGMALELIRHRREGVLRLPQPGYVFTQPARAQLEERQVVTKASREEIVEVVRKEVRSLAANAPAPAAASRAELAGIADEVYSTLVRRLLVEKERLGRA